MLAGVRNAARALFGTGVASDPPALAAIAGGGAEDAIPVSSRPSEPRNRRDNNIGINRRASTAITAPRYSAARPSPAVQVSGRASKLLGSLILKCQRAAAAKPSVANPTKNPQRSKKEVQCTFSLRLSVHKDDPENVIVEELEGHTGHTPGADEDLKWLPLNKNLEEKAAELLLYNTPTQVLAELVRLSDLGKLPKDAAAAARFLTPQQLKNLAKRQLSRRQLHKNDVKATEALLELAGEDNILYYHPQEAEGEEITSDLRLALFPQFGRDMMKKCGSELAFMDAVFGTNQYGFPLLSLVVRDEFGHGVPVAMCIASAENSEIWGEFLAAVLTAAEVDPTKITFMIDKSRIEMAAIRGVGAKFILCHFHMLQEAERLLKSGESGVNGAAKKAQRVAILLTLAQLQKIGDQDSFKMKSEQFKKKLDKQSAMLVKEWYEKNWEKDAIQWAAFGRREVDHLKSNTNNLIERFFHSLKYTYCGRRVKQRLEDLVRIILSKVFPAFICARQRRLSGVEWTHAEAADRRLDLDVAYLADYNNKAYLVTNAVLGRAVCDSRSKNSVTYDLAVGDCSCQCKANRDDVCKHLEAVAQKFPLNLRRMKDAANEMKEQQLILKMEEEQSLFVTDLYEIFPFAHSAREAPAGSICIVNATERLCSCHSFRTHGFCAHLIACTDDGVEMAEALNAFAAESAGWTGDPELFPLEIKRQRRFRRNGETNEMLVDYQSDVAFLHNLSEVKSASSSTTVEAVFRGSINNLMAVVEQLSPQHQSAVAAKLDLLCQDAKEQVPTFNPTHQEEKSHWNRLRKHKIMRVLNPNRTGNTASVAGGGGGDDAVRGGDANKKLIRAKPQGRAVRVETGIAQESLGKKNRKRAAREADSSPEPDETVFRENKRRRSAGAEMAAMNLKARQNELY